ncbi:MAG: helix-turn-helix domain-containing protein, partial [Chloroflexota bacterium]|nr:helix-turn-helix domain-containing protein [Chloroflexota bacterium]
MASLFEGERPGNHRTLPPPMRQLIVDLRAEHRAFRPNEIVTICYVRFGRRPSPHTVQRVLADGPPPSRKNRRYPRYHEIPDAYDRCHAIVTLHAEGWSVKSIAAYLGTSRPTVYDTLRRWVEEGVAGIEPLNYPVETREGGRSRYVGNFLPLNEPFGFAHEAHRHLLPADRRQ